MININSRPRAPEQPRTWMIDPLTDAQVAELEDLSEILKNFNDGIPVSLISINLNQFKGEENQRLLDRFVMLKNHLIKHRVQSLRIEI